MERLHAQGTVVRRLLRAERSVDELCSAEFSLGRRPEGDEFEPSARRARPQAAPTSYRTRN